MSYTWKIDSKHYVIVLRFAYHIDGSTTLSEKPQYGFVCCYES